ncbi:amino acid transporter, partial [Rhodococcus erythropolis]
LPDDLLGILLNAVGAALLVIWIFIVVSHLRLRKQLEASGKLTVRMWLFPYLSYATLAMLGVFVVLMLFDADARAQLISTTVLFLVIAALGFLNARWRKQNQPV